MKEVRSLLEMKNWRKAAQPGVVGFVPTMGALHEGHLSLVRRSLAENDLTVVSIYLNETQFNDPKDLQAYPSNIENDLFLLRKAGVTCVFLPQYQDMYPHQYRYRVVETVESKDLCGQDRPGHFDGVLSVVLKLFNIVQPQRAYFGEKDFQQLQLIKGMVESFFLDIEIVACPTQRDAQGLALSSRNQRLNLEQRKQAQWFAQQLQSERDLTQLRESLLRNGIEIDYLAEKQQRRFAAVKIGSVRLIDNVPI